MSFSILNALALRRSIHVCSLSPCNFFSFISSSEPCRIFFCFFFSSLFVQHPASDNVNIYVFILMFIMMTPSAADFAGCSPVCITYTKIRMRKRYSGSDFVFFPATPVYRVDAGSLFLRSPLPLVASLANFGAPREGRAFV